VNPLKVAIFSPPYESFFVPPSRGESTEPTIAAFSAAQNSSAEPKDNP
jgi:hypothetical protein